MGLTALPEELPEVSEGADMHLFLDDNQVDAVLNFYWMNGYIAIDVLEIFW